MIRTLHKHARTRSTRAFFSCVLAASLCATSATAGELSVATDFEGGSATVVSVDQQARSVTVRPGGDPQRGWPCWWHFRVDGIEPGETISITVDGNGMQRTNGKPLDARWALPKRATWTTDRTTWHQTAPVERVDGRTTWPIKVDAARAWFAWGPAFGDDDALRLVERLAEASPHARRFELCKSRGGRSVPALTITEGGTDDGKRLLLWIQARQHAWESSSSWVGQGFAEWAVSDDPRALALRKKAVTLYVPIMDVDNVATGNGGKEQDPHDHNRDWHDDARYPSVQAAMQRITKADQQGRFVLFVDLHNPGDDSKLPFFFLPAKKLGSPRRSAAQERFVQACRQEMVGSFPLEAKTNSTDSSYDPLWKRISSNWIQQATREHAVGITLETAWNTPHSRPTGYRLVGRQLGLGIERYLRVDPR